MKHKILLFTKLLVFNYIFSQGQSYIQPSPDAMSLFRMTSTSVNHYNGTLGVTVPLTELSSNELKVPVYLTYNGAGNKVQDIASSLGLGWNLVAGGVISRIVRGMPDDLQNGFCTSTNSLDTEPDLYFFNILGRSGKFVLDKQGAPLTTPFQDIIIRPGLCTSGSNGIWEIIDENGVIYKFGKVVTHRETTTTRLVTQSTNQFTYISSWYLSEIISPNGTDQITFNYLATTSSYTNYYFTKYENCYSDLNLKDESTIITANSRLVSSIISNSGRLDFSWRYGRKDLSSGHFLESLTLKNVLGDEINKYRFEYNYFQSDNCSGSLCYRLRLDKVYDLGPDPIYSFTYNTSINLPARNSKNFDHWGYYNSNTVNTWLPEVIYIQIPLAPQLVYSGASRTFDPNKSLANILNRVDYRGGNFKEFEFESHQIAGGARIKRITVGNGNQSPIVTNYKYNIEGNPNANSGVVFMYPTYLLYRDAYSQDLKSELTSGTILSAQRFSSSYLQLFDLDGYHVGYSRVEEIIEGIGKQVYEFTNFNSHPDIFANSNLPYAGVTSKSWERGLPLTITSYLNSGSLTHQEINEFNFNLPNKKSITGRRSIQISYSCQGYGSGYSSNNNSYAIISRPLTLTRRTIKAYDPTNASKVQTRIEEYSYDPTSYQLIKTTQYNSSTPSVKYINETRYVTNNSYAFDNSSYCMDQYDDCVNNNCYLLSGQALTSCLEECESNRVSCESQPPGEYYPETGAIQILRERHQINTPIEVMSIFQNGAVSKILSAQLFTYKKSGSNQQHIVLDKLFATKNSVTLTDFFLSRINDSGVFEKYNGYNNNVIESYVSYHATTGNLLQKQSKSGIQSAYTWSPDGTLPLSTTVSTTGMTLRQTTYTHKPMVGQTSVVDANGNTVKYEYDVFNRLSKVKDKNDHIMKQYRYHYKNETPGFRITSIKESNPGDVVMYYATDVASSVGGNPQLVWDMGDGRVVDNNSTQVSHAYSAPGTYTVKLAGLNPEYGPVTRMQQVVVYPVVTGTICADGPIYVDLCGVNAPYFEHCPGNQNTYASSPVTFTCEVSGGCPSSITYAWKYKRVQDAYWFYATETTNQYTLYPGLTEGSYLVECTVTDGCGKSFTASYSIERYKSNAQCNGGGIGIE